MKNETRFYTITSTTLILLFIVALGWYAFFQPESGISYPSIFTLGLAAFVLFHSRNRALARYGTRRVVLIDLVLIAVNLTTVAVQTFLRYQQMIAWNYDFSTLLGFVVATIAVAALLNYGIGTAEPSTV